MTVEICPEARQDWVSEVEAAAEGLMSGTVLARDGGSVNALLEKEREASEIDAALGSARAGVGRLVVLEGHAGIGKSALLAAAQKRGWEEGLDVLASRGTELDATGSRIPASPPVSPAGSSLSR